MNTSSVAFRVAVAVAAVALLVAAAVLVVDRGGGGRSADVAGPTTAPPTAAPTATPDVGAAEPSPTPSPGIDADAAVDLLSSVEAAAEADPEDLLAAGLVAGRGPWRGLGDPAWPMRGERPVYVGAATLTEDSVEADIVVAQRLDEPTERLRLRLLAAAGGDNDLTVSATVGGRDVPVETDEGGLLIIDLPAPADADTAVTVRISLRYRLLTTAAAPDDSGPAAYGILARSPGTTALGHWLPVLTFEPEPIVPWGDVGSFPVAVWSLRVEHPGILVTGGEEDECPDTQDPGCTWTRGTALREISAVLLDDANEVGTTAAGLAVRSLGPPTIPARGLETAVEEAAVAAEGFSARFGSLAWGELDVVAVPLGQGAAGMEFPGMVMIDDDLYDQLDGGFGTYVLVHEVAHQWFHALVGHGSFSDPVVDESLAQYLSVVAYRDLFGPAAAQALLDRSIAERYERFRSSGHEEEPPAQPSGAFAGPETYGPLVYARAPLAWVAAEDLLGEEGVAAFIAGLVADHGLDVLTADEVRRRAAARDPRFGDIIERYWYDDAPAAIPGG